jgi:Lar family restriction alleviation protein
MDTTKKKKKQVPLKPCPLCGSKRISKERTKGDSLKWITCRTCGGSTGLKFTEAEAIEAWNLRVSEAREPVPLKHCPFCGSAHLAKSGRAPGWIVCRKCGSSTGLKDSRAAALAAWNLRI